MSAELQGYEERGKEVGRNGQMKGEKVTLHLHEKMSLSLCPCLYLGTVLCICRFYVHMRRYTCKWSHWLGLHWTTRPSTPMLSHTYAEEGIAQVCVCER